MGPSVPQPFIPYPRYKERIKICGSDPYDIREDECSTDFNLFPKITEVDRLDYFIYNTNFVDKEAMKCLKSLEAHNFFTSGHVFPPYIKKMSSDSVLILTKVKHSQAASKDPLKTWLLVKINGEIITGHCTCMAGRGETCSHIAAVVFYIEHCVKIRDEQSCTEEVNVWLPPNLKNVPFKRVKEMDFSSPNARLAKISKGCDGGENENSNQTPKQLQEPLAKAVNDFFVAVAQADPKAVVLSTLPQYCAHYVLQEISEELPKLMDTLWDPNNVGLSYKDLIEKSIQIVENMNISIKSIQEVEKITRTQSNNSLWFKFRQGRITASKMKLVCRGNVENPARSTINQICYANRSFYSVDVERGKKLEKFARQKYVTEQKKTHQDLVVKESGLYICKQHPYIACSPDGIVFCSCCDGNGCLGIKCPRDKNMHSCFDKNHQLCNTHDYFYQVQTQLYVCGFQYCDLFIFSETSTAILHRIMPDETFHQEIVEKSRKYFIYVILPELIAKYFTLNRLPLAPISVDSNGETNLICYCQTPRSNPVVKCLGENCTFVEFHCRCVNLITPRKKWLCDQCRVKSKGTKV